MVISELVALLGFKADNTGAREFDSQLSRLQQSAERVANNISSGIGFAIGNMATNLAVGIAGSFGDTLKKIPEAGDAMNTAIAKLTSAMGDSAIAGGEAVAIYEKLYEVGKQTGISANESAQAFTQVKLAFDDLGRPASEAIDMLQGIQSAGIVAGQKTQDVTEAIRQLGQALGKGKLNGDELVSLSERMPRLMRDVQKQMGMTTAEFFKASSSGELTPDKLVPAFISAGKKYTAELANFPMTMGRAYAILTNSVQRFLAEIDKTFQVSQNIAALYIKIANTLDTWRRGLSVISDFIDSLGGMERILRLVEAALIAIAANFVITNIVGLATAFGTIGAAVAGALIPLAAFALAALEIEDFIVWMKGGKSVLGDKFGDFDKVFGEVQAKFQEFADGFKSMLPEIQAQWEAFWVALRTTSNDAVTGMTASFEELKKLLKDIFGSMSADSLLWWEAIKAAFLGISADGEGFINFIKGMPNIFTNTKDAIIYIFDELKAYFASLWDGIGERFNRMIDTIGGGLNRAKSWFGGMLNGGADATQEAPNQPGFMERTRNWLGSIPGWTTRNDIPPGADVAGEAPNQPGFMEHTRNWLGSLPGWATRNDIPPGLDATGRIAAGNTVNAPQSNNITNEITINAPGSDPASVASAAQSGVTQAMDSATVRLGNSLSLGLGIANPRVEMAATP